MCHIGSSFNTTARSKFVKARDCVPPCPCCPPLGAEVHLRGQGAEVGLQIAKGAAGG